MHYHVLRTDTKITAPGCPATTTDVGVAPSYRAGADVIAHDRRNLRVPASFIGERPNEAVVSTWSRFSCDDQAHE